MKLRHDIISCVINNPHKNIEHTIEDFMGAGNYPPEMARDYMRTSDIDSCIKLLIFKHLEYDFPEEFAAKQYAEAAIEISLDYFYGDWSDDDEYQDSVCKSPDNEDLIWIDPFSQGLFCALLLNREQEIEKLCSWVEADLYLDGGLSDMEEHSHYLYMSIAAELRSAPMPGIEEKETAIEQCRKKRSKLLYSVWQAVRSKDQAAFNKTFEESLKHYQKYDLGKEYATDWIAQHQSLLWLLAERNGLSFPELSEKLAALVVTRKTLGLE